MYMYCKLYWISLIYFVVCSLQNKQNDKTRIQQDVKTDTNMVPW